MSLTTTLREKRSALLAEQRTIIDSLAPGESLTDSDQSRFDELTTQKRSISDQIDRHTADNDSEALAASVLGQYRGGVSIEERELTERFRSVIRSRSMEPIEVALPSNQLRSGFRPGIEKRVLTTSPGPGVPTSFYNTIQRHLVESSAILAAGATVLQTSSGEPLRIPRSTALSTAAIVGEGALIPASDPTLGAITLGAFKYGFLVQVSTELAEDASFDLLGFLAEQAGTAVGNAFGAHAITGTGTGQPRGLLTDASAGITGPTGTATSFGSQTTVGQGGDLLMDLVASLAEPYTRSASAAWLMRSSTLNAIRKLRDSQGRYVFDSAILPGSGSAGTLLGRPVYLDPNMPAMAAGARSVLFGDISRYWVRQVNGLRFERSNDFAFANDLTTFRALARLDGALVDTTGAVRFFQHSAT